MTQQTIRPQSTHYVSLQNNSIHPAMTSPAGYEDEHPTEWRAATRAEIARYESDPASMDSVVPKPLPLDAASADAVVTPTALHLQDDGAEDTTPVEEAPTVVPAVPPAPPAPAFTIAMPSAPASE